MRITFNNKGKNTLIWAVKITFRVAHHYISTFIADHMHTPVYLLIVNYLGEVGDIDRVTLPQGTFTPRISVTRCTIFSEFCIERSIEVSP